MDRFRFPVTDTLGMGVVHFCVPCLYYLPSQTDFAIQQIPANYNTLILIYDIWKPFYHFV